LVYCTEYKNYQQAGLSGNSGGGYGLYKTAPQQVVYIRVNSNV